MIIGRDIEALIIFADDDSASRRLTFVLLYLTKPVLHLCLAHVGDRYDGWHDIFYDAADIGCRGLHCRDTILRTLQTIVLAGGDQCVPSTAVFIIVDCYGSIQVTRYEVIDCTEDASGYQSKDGCDTCCFG